ncbi:unnamed protein product [Schistosoma rodhaini]|uniref:Ovule protein n=1 Tax=Schistosoma rodhaini TaxID=6188 RepID=A0A183S465_9TREM|nr:unnamed protein product [Schistosoma rodhaini]
MERLRSVQAMILGSTSRNSQISTSALFSSVSGNCKQLNFSQQNNESFRHQSHIAPLNEEDNLQRTIVKQLKTGTRQLTLMPIHI